MRQRPTKNRKARTLLTLAAALALFVTAAGDAAAQQGSSAALNQFHPAPAGDRFFGVQSPEAEGHVSPKLMILGEYAKDPLVLVRESGGETTEAGVIVSDQMFLHFGATLALWERLALSLDFPLALVNTGDAPAGFASPSGAAPGDLRAGLRLRVLGAGPLQVALAGYFWFPTGDPDARAGAGVVRGSPGLVIGGRAGAFIYALNGGFIFNPSRSGAFAPLVAGGASTGAEHQLTFGGGVGIVVADDRLQLGPEVYGNTVVNGARSFDVATTNMELLFGAKLRAGPIVLGAGAGPGLTTGIGTPSLRAVGSITFAPQEDDRDHDGIEDDDDACPDVPGSPSSDPKKNGCPEPSDRDNDGVLDHADACVDTPGIRTPDPATNGCPDTDGDGIFDLRDACPKVAGVHSQDPKKHGCPDRDKDGVFDAEDACPEDAGPPSNDPKTNGCPDRDGDGFADPVDACPEVKGVANADPAKNGCPADTDGDGILDDKDACPEQKGEPNEDPKRHGCPKVFVTATKIEILEQVQFKTGSDVILPESDELLTNVAKVLADHPEIKRVLVEGHTDNRGGKAFNDNLSKRRAASVKKWLVTRGKIAADRLESRGFGMDRPIASNDTEEGRQKNRRVAFTIVDKTEAATPSPKP